MNLKTYLSRRRMRQKLQAQMKPVNDIIKEMTLNRDKYLQLDRVGSNEKNYYKGWFEALKWVVGEDHASTAVH